jgi:hypothetical protein
MVLKYWKRALALGFLSWSFVFGFMSVAVILVAAPLARRYFRDGTPRVAEAALLGLRMSPARYYSEIGAGYLLYPAFLTGACSIAGKRPRAV